MNYADEVFRILANQAAGRGYLDARRQETNDAAPAGTFEVVQPPVWREDREAALDAFTTAANKQVEGELADVIGTLSVAPRRHSDDAFNGLCIRSRPLPAIGGAEFWFNTGSSGPDVPAAFLAGDVAPAAQRFVANREEVARIAEAARVLTDQVLRSGENAHPPARLVAISVVASRRTEGCETVVTVETLGDGLTLGPDTLRVPSSDLANLREELQALLEAHTRRAILIAGHLASRSRGLVDQTAQRVMAAAGMDPAFAVDQLERRSVLQFRFDGGRMLGSLEWKDGVLTGEVNEPSNEAYIWDGSFTFWERLGEEEEQAALIGRPLSTVIDRPYFPGDAIIRSVGHFGNDGTRMDLEIPTSTLPDVGMHVWNGLV